MKRGFIPLVAIVIISLVSVLAAVGGYAVYKYNEVTEEKEVIEEQLNDQKEKEIQKLEAELRRYKEDGVEESKIEKATITVADAGDQKHASQPTQSDNGKQEASYSNKSNKDEEELNSAKLSMRSAYDSTYSAKAVAVANSVIHQSRIDNAQENIDYGKGFIKVYPELNNLILYFEKIYLQQISYEKEALSFNESTISYYNVILDAYNKVINNVDSLSDNDLDLTITFFEEAQQAVAEYNTAVKLYITNSNSLETQIEGIVDAASAKNSSAGMPSTIQVVYPEVTAPAVNMRTKCFSESFISGTLTTCN